MDGAVDGGGRDVFGQAGVHSASIQPDDLQKANPDFLTRQNGWGRLKAVQKGQVYVVDVNAFFNRSGPRLVESAEILAEILHPESFNFGHCANAWRQWLCPIKNAKA